jgi:hypothetical protein
MLALTLISFRIYLQIVAPNKYLVYNRRMSALDEVLNLWIHRLRAIAQTGLAFGPSVYDRERYEEMLELAAQMAATREDLTPGLCYTQSGHRRGRV